ncbi:hypothetical protein a10_08669 [Streptomyces acidiscabies]|nr:hypothetical protein a10_08669 [Streptomyces acidiscabies]GAV45707.1 hypothetical protein Saa2_08699 [Streptomyces acidiscabies]
MQRSRQLPIPQRLDHLDDPGDPRRRLRMPDVRLHRPEPQRPLRSPPLPINSKQRPRLDGVTKNSPRPMRLDNIDVLGRQPRISQRRPDDPLLRRPVRRREPVARPVLVDGGPPQHGKDPMPMALCLGEEFEDDHPGTLTPPGPVGGCGERLAPPVGRQPPLPGELGERPGRGHDGRAPGQREGALAPPQRLRRQVDRHERRRAGRVDRHRRTFEPQRVGDPPRHDAAEVAGPDVPLHLAGGLVEQHLVVVRAHPREDARVAALEGLRVETGVFDGLPGGLQE